MMHSHFVSRIVARAKLDMPGDHWGVEFWPGLVMHLTLQGLRVDTLAVFQAGKPLKEIRRALPGHEDAIMWRVRAARANPPKYHLVDNNCEVFANHLLGLPEVSPQVQGVALLALVGALILATN